LRISSCPGRVESVTATRAIIDEKCKQSETTFHILPHVRAKCDVAYRNNLKQSIQMLNQTLSGIRVTETQGSELNEGQAKAQQTRQKKQRQLESYVNALEVQMADQEIGRAVAVAERQHSVKLIHKARGVLFNKPKRTTKKNEQVNIETCSTSALTEAAMKRMSIVQLQARALACNLETTGLKKNDIITRLKAWQSELLLPASLKSDNLTAHPDVDKSSVNQSDAPTLPLSVSTNNDSVKELRRRKKVPRNDDDDIDAYEDIVDDEQMKIDDNSSNPPRRRPRRETKTIEDDEEPDSDNENGDEFDCEYQCIKRCIKAENETQVLVRWHSSVKCYEGKEYEWKWASDIPNKREMKKLMSWGKYQTTSVYDQNKEKVSPPHLTTEEAEEEEDGMPMVEVKSRKDKHKAEVLEEHDDQAVTNLKKRKYAQSEDIELEKDKRKKCKQAPKLKIGNSRKK
jgi:hypothetical protein